MVSAVRVFKVIAVLMYMTVDLFSDIPPEIQIAEQEKAKVVYNDLDFSECDDPYFAIAVAIVESGRKFDSKLAITKNNIFGLHGKSFESKQDCIKYFNDLMNKRLYKDKTVDEISKIYCPPNSKRWASMVKQIMEEFMEELKT